MTDHMPNPAGFPRPPQLPELDALAAVSSVERVEQLEAQVAALQRDWPEDQIRAMTDEQLAGLSEALSEQRRLIIDRSRFVQSIQDERARAVLEQRVELLAENSAVIGFDTVGDTSSVGGRPTNG